MELPKINILNENNKTLRTKSSDIDLPLSNKDKKLIKDMMDYLEISQIEEYRTKYDLRAGMGMAFIQIGVPKRIFVIVRELEDKTFEKYVIINPKIKSQSEELIYVGEGEGCLSIERDTEGIVPRNARMTITYYNEDGEECEIRVREELSVAFQHELDHLDGILFVDKIDFKNPYRNQEIMREI